MAEDAGEDGRAEEQVAKQEGERRAPPWGWRSPLTWLEDTDGALLTCRAQLVAGGGLRLRRSRRQAGGWAPAPPAAPAPGGGGGAGVGWMRVLRLGCAWVPADGERRVMGQLEDAQRSGWAEDGVTTGFGSDVY
ncbi:hypothetical protein TSOC_001764 [Tetrabaena socialis]|uniref:Uncharacterized protein n=1 Tax=Tetrabaena socialis TaxID=47790 RepID=A0A2J8AFQ5_9CHLO|nr:hypothetical protein TSOC_001764 [Tetrabaena socialis]|eukprot:PNH11351.1 hypothetical protein TSOC_001764 [Tetrabaena socialis]